MKQVFKSLLPALICLISFITGLQAQDFPAKPGKLVNDYSNTLSADEIARLEQKLVAFDDSSSTQIAVVLIKSLEGYDVADYAVRLAENWGVGQAKKNNGVMLLVSIGDRKVTIQTGYGVEGALPDAIARRIIENEIKPDFKNENYFAGIEKGTDAIISYTKGEYKNDAPKKSKRSGRGFPIGAILVFIIVIIALISRGGGGGGGRQVIGSRGSASPFWWLLMGSAMSGGRSSGGGFGGFSGGGGGGGFGGFGGGSFGGGGASGSW